MAFTISKNAIYIRFASTISLFVVKDSKTWTNKYKKKIEENRKHFTTFPQNVCTAHIFTNIRKWKWVDNSRRMMGTRECGRCTYVEEDGGKGEGWDQVKPALNSVHVAAIWHCRKHGNDMSNGIIYASVPFATQRSMHMRMIAGDMGAEEVIKGSGGTLQFK